MAPGAPGAPPAPRAMAPEALPQAQRNLTAQRLSQDQTRGETPPQGLVAMTSQEQVQFARQVQHVAQQHIATEFSRPVSQQGFAALAAASPSLYQDEHSPGKSSEETMISTACILPRLTPDSIARNIAEEKERELMDQSATKIQTVWRGHFAYSSYKSDLLHIIILQSLIRYRAARNVAEQKRREFMDHSATAIQTVWRGYCACLTYERDLLGIIIVQSLARRRVAENIADQTRRQLMDQGATVIQTAWRGYCAYSSYQSDIFGVVIMQCLVRRQVATNIAEQKRRKLMDQFATKIQTAWRGYCAHSSCRSARRHIIIVQSLVRHREARIITEQKRRELMDQSATTIQTAWRGHDACSSYQSGILHIIIVQALVRGRVARKITDQKRRQLMDQSATKIQTAWRGYYMCSSYKSHILDIIIVQSLVRGRAARKITDHKRRELMVQSATKIQTAWRSYCACLSYQSYILDIIIVQSLVRDRVARKITDQKRRLLMDQSATKIQTAWRGYCAYSDGKRRVSIQETAEVGSRVATSISSKKRRLNHDTSSSTTHRLPFVFPMPSNPSVDPGNVADDNADATHIQDFVRDEGIKHQTATVEELRGLNAVMNNNDDGFNNNSLSESRFDEDDYESEDELRPSGATVKKNRAISIHDVTSQGEVESVATGTEDLQTTRETSHEAKNVSDQDETDSDAMETSFYNTGEMEIPSIGAGAKTSHHAEENSAHKPHHRHHHHQHHLNEDTLDMLKSHLQSVQGGYLDEDALAARILKMDRVKRSRFQHDLCEVSEEEDNDAALRQAYQAEEDHTLALDFYNDAVADTRKENPDTVLDKKTLDWLRKAMGLRRRDDLWETPGGNQAEQSDESDDEAGSQGPKPRHLTRGVARSTRIRKREQRATRENMGLDALMSAVTDLEEEHGPFRGSMSRKKRNRQKRIRHALNASDEKCEKCHRSTVEPSLSLDTKKRKRQKSSSHADNAADEKYEKRHRSIIKPSPVKIPDEKYENRHRSTVTPRVSLDTTAPVLSRRGGEQLHCLATLAQRFNHIVTTSGSQDIDLKHVVDQLGIPKRRIYDVVNILEGAGVMERTRERNQYHWIPQVDFSHELTEHVEEKCQLEEEERKLDVWIKLQTAPVEELKRMYAGTTARGEVQESPGLDGETRACKPPCKETTEKMKQGDTADTAKKNHVNSSSVEPSLSLDMMAPVLSRVGGERKVHCLATLAKRFRQIVTTSGSHVVDLKDVVDQLGIPRRRIYDVVNILVGADVMELTTERNKYGWIPQGSSSNDLKELEDEERRLIEEERQLDEWIKLVSNCNSIVDSPKAGSKKTSASSTNGSS